MSIPLAPTSSRWPPVAAPTSTAYARIGKAEPSTRGGLLHLAAGVRFRCRSRTFFISGCLRVTVP
jgi:hypothetical protein